jgi:hypothetical protein
MMLQEPRLPPISTPADVSKEHIEWAEDMVCEWMGGHGYLARQVGWLAGGADVQGSDAAAAAEVVKDAEQALHEEDEASTAPDSGVLR